MSQTRNVIRTALMVNVGLGELPVSKSLTDPGTSTKSVSPGRMTCTWNEITSVTSTLLGCGVAFVALVGSNARLPGLVTSLGLFNMPVGLQLMSG